MDSKSAEVLHAVCGVPNKGVRPFRGYLAQPDHLASLVDGYCFDIMTAQGPQIVHPGDGIPNICAALPICCFLSTGHLPDIVNATLARRMVFDKVFINTGETVTIDLNPGAKNITSDWRGNMLGYLEPGSDFTNFKLKGRTGNKVAITITSSGAEAGASVNYYKQYKSVDGLFS